MSSVKSEQCTTIKYHFEGRADEVVEVVWPLAVQDIPGGVSDYVALIDTSCYQIVSGQPLDLTLVSNYVDEHGYPPSLQSLDSLHLAVLFRRHDVIDVLCQYDAQRGRKYGHDTKFLDREIRNSAKDTFYNFTALDVASYCRNDHALLQLRKYATGDVIRHLSRFNVSKREAYNVDSKNHAPQAVAFLKEYDQNVHNIITLFFQHSAVTAQLTSRYLRFVVAGLILHYEYPALSLHWCLDELANKAQALSDELRRTLTQKLTEEVKTIAEDDDTPLTALCETRLKQSEQQFLRKQPNGIRLFAFDYTRHQMAKQIVRSDRRASDMDGVFTMFMCPVIRAINIIANKTVQRYLDNVPFNELYQFPAAVCTQKRDLITRYLHEAIHQGYELHLAADKVNEVINQLSRTQLRRDDLANILLPYLTRSQDCVSEQKASLQHYQDTQIDYARITQMTLLDF